MNDILNDIGAAILAQEHGLTDLANRYWAQVLARLDGLPLTVDVPLDEGKTMIVTIQASRATDTPTS